MKNALIIVGAVALLILKVGLPFLKGFVVAGAKGGMAGILGFLVVIAAIVLLVVCWRAFKSWWVLRNIRTVR